MVEATVKTLSDAPSATPGYLTTEFWKSSVVTVVGLLITTGVISPDSSAKYNQWVQVAAVLATALSVGLYSLSRGKTKAAAIEAAAGVIMQNKHIALQRELSGITTPSAPVANAEVQQT